MSPLQKVLRIIVLLIVNCPLSIVNWRRLLHVHLYYDKICPNMGNMTIKTKGVLLKVKPIILEGSARHAHVTAEALAVLFGEGAMLHNKRELSQPGQYLTEEKVRIEGPRGAIDRVSILGPERPVTQVEISLTDARTLGVEPPIRESGDVLGSAPIRIVGPAGSLDLAEGCIVAKRHLHIPPDDAEVYGVTDKQVIGIKTCGARGLIFNEVVVRVNPNFATRVHLDYDEMNAAGLGADAVGEIIK